MNELRQAELLSIAAMIMAVIFTPGLAEAKGPQKGRGGTGITKDTEFPHCEKSYGSIALVEEKQPDPRDQLSGNMAALLRLAEAQNGVKKIDPVPLARLMAQRSRCFQVVERGKASGALAREREMAGITQKLVAADYLMTVEVVYSDSKAKGYGGGGGFLGGAIGFKSKTAEAQVLLTFTNVKTGVQDIISSGSARKKDIGIVGGGVLLGAGIGALGGAYTSTNIGKVTSIAMLDAYIGMVKEAKTRLVPRSPGTVETPQTVPATACVDEETARQMEEKGQVPGCLNLEPLQDAEDLIEEGGVRDGNDS